MLSIEKYAQKPVLYQKSEVRFWDDPYISQNMLKAHLNPQVESATRKLDFVKQSVNWIANILPVSQYERLLDLGCGPGIYAELFHEKGYQVTGIDLSENSIQYAKKSANNKALDIKYLKGDYIQSPILDEYDLATMIYCDFGVLSNKERKELLKKVYNALSPNGCFLFDVFTPAEYTGRNEFKKWSYEKYGFWRDTPYLLLQSLYHYRHVNTFLNQYIIVTDDGTTCYNNWEHTFSVEELETGLLEAGFSQFQFYKNVAGSTYEHDSKTICVIAKKE